MINVLIVNWNSGGQCLQLIHSLVKSEFANYRIVMIDNDSSESDILKLKNCEEIASLKKVEFHLIRNASNLGYAGGNNAGFSYLKNKNLAGDILILNPDVTLQPNTLSVMSKVLIQEGIAGVMVRTFIEGGKLMYDYFSLNGFVQKWLYSKDNSTVETDYLAGSCMLLNRKLIDRLGLFDDSFFLYWEEVDLSIRLKNAGFRLMSTNETFIIRFDNELSRKSNSVYYLTRNAFLLLKNHANLTGVDLTWYLLRMFISSVFISIKTFDFRFLLNYLKGFASGCYSYLSAQK
ncbi:glycosyltransferase family 2 protein [Aquirufa sp. LEPPI-3A]|uniref:glycosyltransferase family 2 protein n=1 Tax=Aquirufa regiilacus TaxID=3024868 RepID=UPI0028DD9E2A|nr:glycosyltransferase family 2 protein [Aquirufa sp. LEPPI-3A]MDT8887156.1 glycosyltransferase family 2 protein [Aquirufa sp. LEPPI-3A]